jgi:chloramphenicol-sensitive protein RarD
MNKQGIILGAAAYALWGFFPIYWKLLGEVPAMQLLGNRIVWSFLLLGGVILLRRQWRDFRSMALATRAVPVYVAAAALISVNWLMYVWAVNAGFVVETSLGYFINPLLSMLLGVAVLRERLRAAQWLCLGLAVAGVLYLTLTYGRLPWIALVLAVSFGLYGLVKKRAPLSPQYGLTLETGILFLPAAGTLALAAGTGTGALFQEGLRTDVLLVLGGAVTVVPLLLFAGAAQRLPLTVLGPLQYIAPTVQFLLGVLVFSEPFTARHLVGFSLVWASLALFTFEGYVAVRAKRAAVREAAAAPR